MTASVSDSRVSEQALYLFSSNTSPQYTQDILNVIGLPKGSRYVFRYAKALVETSIAATEEKWRSIEGREGLVCFSLQQTARYVPAVFIPVRSVRIISAHTVGSTHIVEFELNDMVTIRPVTDEAKRPQQVREFSEWVRENVNGCPYDSSVSLGKPIPHYLWTGSDDQPLIFEALTRWLSRAEPFLEARFVRFGQMAEAGSDKPAVLVGERGRLEVEAGKTYQLRIVQHQGHEITDKQAFVVSSDVAHVAVIGRPGFEVASQYDEITISLQVAPSTGLKSIETVIVIEPSSGNRGPRLELPIRVSRPTKETVFSVIGPVLVLALLGIPSALKARPGIAIGCVLIGLIGVATLQLLGIGVASPSNAFPVATAVPVIKIDPSEKANAG